VLVSGAACDIWAGASAATLPATPSTADGWTERYGHWNDEVWSGGDQASSYKASNGATYWLFGDTILGERTETNAYRPGWRMIGNTMLVERDGEFSPAAPGRAIPDAPNGDRYWPTDAFEVAGFLYVTAQRVSRQPLGFDVVGAELAKFQFVGDEVQFLGMLPTPTQGTQSTDVQWSASVVASGSDLYIFGFKLFPGDREAPHRSYLAKVPTWRATDPAAWEFWNGCTWSGERTTAAPIVASQVSNAAFINGKWVIAHKPFNGYGNAVMLEVGAEATGPYESWQAFESPAGTWKGLKYFTYSTQLHPEQSLAAGGVLVSVSWNFNEPLMDTGGQPNGAWRKPEAANLYKPRFYEVTVP
jgi:hypothetical protein